jgi:AcrR family transcriptional regulator
MALTVKQIADYAGISTSSVRLWGRELAPVLSDGANPKAGVARHYTKEDAGIFHTAKVLKSEGQGWEQIIEAVNAGDRILPTTPPPHDPSDPAPSPQEPVDNLPAVPMSAFERIISQLEQERVAHETTRNNLLEATERAVRAETQAEQLPRLQQTVESEVEARSRAEEEAKQLLERATRAEVEAELLKAQLDEMSQPTPPTSPSPENAGISDPPRQWWQKLFKS